MPELSTIHPIVVHFVVALGIIGVAFRLVSLTGKLGWTGPAATVLILIAAVASVIAVQSGAAAHQLAERIPGVREAVEEHEELGEMTRNLFLIVGVVELAAFFLRARPAAARWLPIVSGAVGLVACLYLYEAGEHGGELVYSYAGGVGTRTGDTTDVHRLLVAGLYHSARIAREAGNGAEAARLTDDLVRAVPGDPSVALLSVESLIKDRKDPQAALAALAAMPVPADDPRAAVRIGLLQSDAWVAAGQTDSARAVLTALSQKFPDSRWIADALARLK